MITMSDAVDIYRIHYYGNNSEKETKYLNASLNNTPIHDMFHIISSGILNLNNPEIKDSLEYFEKRGLVNKLIGAKAEIIQKIYSDILNDLDENIPIDIESYKNKILPNYFTKIMQTMKNHITEIDGQNTYFNFQGDEKKQYSHIPAVSKLFEYYKNNKPMKLNDSISENEIEFHIDRASELYSKIKEKHPECFYNGNLQYDKLLDLNVKDLAVDNLLQGERMLFKETMGSRSI